MKQFLSLFTAASILLIAPTMAEPVHGQVHGLSLIGNLKYAPNFEKFDYVNPNAPKKGTLRLSVEGAFDKLNPVSPRGVAAPSLSLMYDTLMKRAADEISSEYGLLAESVDVAPNITHAIFKLRSTAKWHDGTQITPDDVVFSFNSWKKGSVFTSYYANIIKAEKISASEVKFTFDQPNNKELPQILGQLIVLPKAYWEGKDSKGNPRDINAPTTEIPLGSGPYKIKSVEAGRSITYERAPNYWGEKLNVNVGHHNFEEIRYTVYRDDTAVIEDFKADRIDFRIENRAKNWATAYDIPAIKTGKMLKETYPRKSEGVMQAFALNIRREKFADPRIRKALNYIFDFEHLNRTIFYGQYERCNSFYAGLELASKGLPEGEELSILKALKHPIPQEVFTKEFKNPVGGDEINARTNLRAALELFKAAGYTIDNKKLKNAKGEPFTMEFMIASPAFEPIVLIYVQNLEKLGITATVRNIDPTQYITRLRARDYDVVVANWGQSLTPGNEQRGMWGSKAANDSNSQNAVGIQNPAVDELIEKIIFAKNRESQVAATKALDRVLLWNHYVIPQWRLGSDRFVYWNRFEYPKPMPEYNNGFPEIWWAK